ncbi:hypothetical protein MAPG_02027 [Magnaporthiopsis poae ATCC 64411]|uniref:Uncharacterized protein n=1 Tax=Magnaporthiopsis poae (strain ATCC 64411 / 73-15) TaxID=644358 RepID=A0A0C4DQ89_MAGP6|nr:hypothetical protein MAPG_02027 [Magnaporthiopsis poae ATCC 64411]
MVNGKRSTSQPGEDRQKSAKRLRRAGPSISNADRCEYPREPSTYQEPLSYLQNSESASQGGQLGAPAAAVYSQTSPSTPAPTTVSSHHEEYGAEPQDYTAPLATAHGGGCSSGSDYAYDDFTNAAWLNRISMTATQGSVHGSRHNSRDMADLAGTQSRPLSLSRVPELPIEERMDRYGGAATQLSPPFSLFTTSFERTWADNDRYRVVQHAGSLVMGNVSPPPDDGRHQLTIDDDDDQDHDIDFPAIAGYPHNQGA